MGPTENYKETFGNQYIQCGCPLPPSSTLNRTKLVKKGTSFFSKLSGSAKQKSPVSEPAPLIPSPTIPGNPMTPEENAATHPSDHNAVHFWNLYDTAGFREAQTLYKSLEKEWRQRTDEPKKGRLSISHTSPTSAVGILVEAESKKDQHDLPGFVTVKLPPKLTSFTVDQLQAHRFLVDRRSPLPHVSLFSDEGGL